MATELSGGVSAIAVATQVDPSISSRRLREGYVNYPTLDAHPSFLHGALGIQGKPGRCDLGAAGGEVGHALHGTRKFIWGVQCVGNRLYASDMVHGLWTLDVTALRR